jgi:peptidoglycan/xylan/chitin deacetylase (PgdA/CDA1 family)
MHVLRRIGRQLRNQRDARAPAILLYHRVARLDHDPWNLAIDPDLFEDQVSALSSRRKVVPLEALADELDRGYAPKDWVAITFDDGYADVWHQAYPILAKLGCPATLFVTTGVLDTDGFWWDRLAEAVLTPAKLPLPATLWGNERPPLELAEGNRNSLHLALWRRMRTLNPERREGELRRIEAWAGISGGARAVNRALTTQELRELADSAVFSVGAHTITHAVLPELTDSEKAAEISGSMRQCEQILGRPVATFAYPFGEMDTACQVAVSSAGFRLACSTVRGPVRRTSPRFALPRISVGRWSGQELLGYLPWGP